MKSKFIESQRRQQEVNDQYRSFRLMLIYVVPLSLMLAAGCKKTEATPPAAAPSSAAPASPTPAVAAKPVPSFSAAEKIGMFVYPKANQTHDQQLIDEADCYNTVQQQTGIDPQAGGPQAPSAADVSAAQEQGAAQADQAKGGRAKGPPRAPSEERRLAQYRAMRAVGQQSVRA